MKNDDDLPEYPYVFCTTGALHAVSSTGTWPPEDYVPGPRADYGTRELKPPKQANCKGCGAPLPFTAMGICDYCGFGKVVARR